MITFQTVLELVIEVKFLALALRVKWLKSLLTTLQLGQQFHKSTIFFS